jgi:hypothetical protein
MRLLSFSLCSEGKSFEMAVRYELVGGTEGGHCVSG